MGWLFAPKEKSQSHTTFAFFGKLGNFGLYLEFVAYPFETSCLDCSPVLPPISSSPVLLNLFLWGHSLVLLPRVYSYDNVGSYFLYCVSCFRALSFSSGTLRFSLSLEFFKCHLPFLPFLEVLWLLSSLKYRCILLTSFLSVLLHQLFYYP